MDNDSSTYQLKKVENGFILYYYDKKGYSWKKRVYEYDGTSSDDMKPAFQRTMEFLWFRLAKEKLELEES